MDGDHEACYQELKRLDADWKERYDRRNKISAVILCENGKEKYLKIDRILNLPGGMIVFVQ